ncbi:MAG TPA: response regulator [Polyangiaceae bacterium]|nr:response regulator [Polyangiaceae bacterium]
MPEPASALLLIVNDDAPSRYLLARYLRQGGFRVLEANDGAEALEVVARERPDLVVLDVRLPNVSGYEVGRRLRAEPETAGIGILYVSAYYPVDVVNAEAGDGDAYMAQPIDQTELLTTVRLVLKTRRGS